MEKKIEVDVVRESVARRGGRWGSRIWTIGDESWSVRSVFGRILALLLFGEVSVDPSILVRGRMNDERMITVRLRDQVGRPLRQVEGDEDQHELVM